jgi:hypothetical protein
MAWFTAPGDRSIIRFARSRDGCKTFSPAVDLQGGVLDVNHPSLARVGGETWAVFQGRDPKAGGWGGNRAWLVRIPDAGSPLAPAMLPAEPGNARYARITAGVGGRVYVAQTCERGDGPRAELWRGRTSDFAPVTANTNAGTRRGAPEPKATPARR